MDYITTKEAAELQGCTERYIRKLCKTGAVECKVSKSVKGKDMYLIPVSALSEQAQHKYGKQLRESMQLLPETAESKPPAKRKKQREQKPLEAYSAQERDKIALWCQIIKDWMDTRASYGKRSEADPLFVAKCKLEHPELEISLDILYRKYAAYKQNDYDGILGIRGGWNKGKSRIPPEIWNVYLYYWLDDNQPTAFQSYLNTLEWCRDYMPELLDSIPSERAFRYRANRDVENYVKCMAREGQKACHDRYAPYIVRWYDDLNANDCWIADNHTIDVQSVDDKDKQHRLYIIESKYVQRPMIQIICLNNRRLISHRQINRIRNILLLCLAFFVIISLQMLLGENIQQFPLRRKHDPVGDLLWPVIFRYGDILRR